MRAIAAMKQQVGRYEIERKVGEGGFGIVYQATDTTLERPVALKLLKADLSSSPEHIKRFARESRVLGALNHPNIIRILDVLEEEGRYYLVMDYLPGGSLADKLLDGQPLPLNQALALLQPIAKAIDYAHSKNLIHRDIKPSNILFTESGDPVLSDFGLVKSIVEQGVSTTRASFGTPEYMAPEQVLGRELTPAVDIYALGVVAYQALSGGLPFTGATPYEIQEGHVHREPLDVTAINQALPANLSAILAKALAKNPAERYDSARTFVDEIEKESRQKDEVAKTAKLAAAGESLNKKDFASAAVMLQELLAVQPEPVYFEMLSECQRREEIWGQFQKMNADQAVLWEKIETLENEEPWLLEDKGGLPEDDDISEGEPQSRLDKVEISFLILLSIFVLILAIMRWYWFY